MKRKEFDRTVSEIAGQLIEYGYGIDVVNVFICFSRSLSKKYPNDEVDIDISAAGGEYLEALSGQLSFDKIRHKKRQLRFITSYIETGVVDVSYADRTHRKELCADHYQLLTDYNNNLVAEGKSESSIRKWDGYAYRFLSYLEKQGKNTIGDIVATDINSFIHWVSKIHSITGLDGELVMLRSLLRFTDDKELTVNALWWVPRGRYINSAPVPVYQDAELELLFEAIDTDTAIGKRDIAIMSLALSMGLRASDIVTLKLKNIDWENRAITINQAKTGKKLRLPMPERTAAFLADYILKVRPESGYEEVFLIDRKPVRPFYKGSSLWARVRKYTDIAGINKQVDGKQQRIGLHRMRHTHATKMLNAGCAPADIAVALGHTKVENAQTYIRLDTETLRSCCLSLPEAR